MATLATPRSSTTLEAVSPAPETVQEGPLVLQDTQSANVYVRFSTNNEPEFSPDGTCWYTPDPNNIAIQWKCRSSDNQLSITYHLMQSADEPLPKLEASRVPPSLTFTPPTATNTQTGLAPAADASIIYHFNVNDGVNDIDPGFMITPG